MTTPTVLFVCVHNAGRSQMAAALLEGYAGERITVLSAGSAPAESLNPAVVEVMGEIGIDLTGRVPRKLSTESVQAADVVITMGCGDTCPVFPGKQYLDWDVQDPAGLPLVDVRPIRDEIGKRVSALADQLLD
jgi:protein-tyrosine-phosphatase